MSRHRDVRNMDFSDDYDGYDDIYGHSVDDDYSISPSNRQYLYNREHSTRSSEGDIKEEEEEELSDIMKAKLELCLKHVREVLGPINLSKEEIVNVAVSHGYDPDMTIASLLENPALKQTEKEKDVTRRPLNHFKITQTDKNSQGNLNKKSPFSIPNIFDKNPQNSKSFNVPNVFATQKSSGSDLDVNKKNFNVPNIFNAKKGNFIAPDLKGKNGFNIPNIFNNQNSNFNSKNKTNFNIPNIFTTQNSNLATLDSKLNFNPDIPDLNKLSISEFTKPQRSFTSLSEIVDSHLSELKCDALSEDMDDLKIDDREISSVLKDPCILKVPLNLRKRKTNFAKVIGRRYRHPNERSSKVHSVFQKYVIRDIEVFQFGTPSPDDVITSHLKSFLASSPPLSTSTLYLYPKPQVPTLQPPLEDLHQTKVVSSTPKTALTITKGFDLPPKTPTPRSASPASGRGSPDEMKTPSSKVRDSRIIDPKLLYKKERGEGKDHLYMVVIGHVDAGKSTLMGHLLWALGQVNQRVMHKYEQESRKLGKQSFMYAWVLDETGEERNRGITMDIGRFQFETPSKTVTLLDAPGHKDFIPNMISGAGQADVALLVVDATRGEFETGFDYGGQTREHALLVRSLGVTQLAVAINKLDTVSWSQERFLDIKKKLQAFLKQAGFKETDVTYVPCSGLTGQNLVSKPTENELVAWYDGMCLLEVIDNFRSPERPVSKPFRLSVNDVFKGTGTNFCVSGRVETGTLSVGDRILVCPNRDQASVKSLTIEETTQSVVFAGDQVTAALSGVEMQNVSVGNVLCDPQNPVPVASRFQARIVVFNVTVPITKGFPVILHHQSLAEPVVVSRLISQLNKSTGEVVKKHPRFLGNNTSAIVEIQVSRPIALELYSECKELGRVMLRVGGVTIAAGLICKIIL